MADTELTKAVVGIAWVVVVGLVGVIWTMLNAKIDGVKSSIDKCVGKGEFDQHKAEDRMLHDHMRGEMDVHRSHIAKIFDKMQEAEQRAVNRHMELMTLLANANKFDRRSQ